MTGPEEDAQHVDREPSDEDYADMQVDESEDAGRFL